MPSAGAEGALGAKMVAERHTVASRRLGVPDLKGDFGVAVSAKACITTSSLYHVAVGVHKNCCACLL